MTKPTLTEILVAVEATLAPCVTYSQAYNELTEAITDMPLLQVYFESGRVDAATQNDRTTFGAGVRNSEYVIIADVYAAQRGPGIGEEMSKLITAIDAAIAIIEAQDTKPLFGLAGIQAFGPVSFDRVTFNYGDPQANYVGCRFRIPVKVH